MHEVGGEDVGGGVQTVGGCVVHVVTHVQPQQQPHCPAVSLSDHNWLVGWLDGWMDGWMVGWLVGWRVGWLVGWLDGCLVSCLVGGLVGLLVCLID